VASFTDKWILHKLNKAITKSTASLESYNFGEAATAMYDFWLKHLCDVYLEVIKPIMYGADCIEKETTKSILYKCLSDGLKLLHPIIPFITEELYHRLPNTPETLKSICITKYPIANP